MKDRIEVVVNEGHTIVDNKVEKGPGGRAALDRKEAAGLVDLGIVSYAEEVDAAEAEAAKASTVLVTDDGNAELVKKLTETNDRLQVKVSELVAVNENLQGQVEVLTPENEELRTKVEEFETAATEANRQAILAEVPGEDRQKIVEVLKAMIESGEGCGENKVPNVGPLNDNLKGVTTVKVKAALRDALMGEIN